MESFWKNILETMDYLDISEDDFHRLCNEFRSPHLWKFADGEWKLRKTIK